MTHSLRHRLDSLRFGAPLDVGALTLVPLVGPAEGPQLGTLGAATWRDPVVFDEELPPDGEHLIAHNRGPDPVLLLDGEPLIGSPLALVARGSVLLPPGFRGPIAVRTGVGLGAGASAVPVGPDEVGAVFVRDGRAVGLAVFGQPGTWARFAARMVEDLRPVRGLPDGGPGRAPHVEASVLLSQAMLVANGAAPAGPEGASRLRAEGLVVEWVVHEGALVFLTVWFGPQGEAPDEALDAEGDDTSARRAKAERLVREFTATAGLMGAIPVPGVAAALVAHNAAMVAAVAHALGAEVGWADVVAAFGLVDGANVLGRTVFVEAARLLGWFGGPLGVWGISALGATTAALQTWTIGQLTVALCEAPDGRLDPERARAVVDEAGGTFPGVA